MGGDEVDYAELTIAELREHARDADIHGRSQMNKAELVAALESPEEKTAAAKEAGQAGAGDPAGSPPSSHGVLHPPRIWPD